jgi:hypothetical protein
VACDIEVPVTVTYDGTKTTDEVVFDVYGLLEVVEPLNCMAIVSACLEDQDQRLGLSHVCRLRCTQRGQANSSYNLELGRVIGY